MEKLDWCRCGGVGKDTGLHCLCIPFHCMYIFDIQRKTDPRNTNSFLQSHEEFRGFREYGRAWTFSSTVDLTGVRQSGGAMTEKALWASQETHSWKRKGPANGPMRSNICLSTAINCSCSWRTDHSTDTENIQNQPAQSYWCVQIRTRKIEEEASQKN